VVAQGVPGQLGDQAVVLVGVGAAGDDDQVGVDLALEPLEYLLDLGPGPGEEAVPERLEHHRGLLDVLQEGGRAGHRLTLPDPGGRQHHPGDAQRNAGRGQVQDGAAAADLDIVGVRADGQDLDRPAGCRPELDGEHLGRPRAHWNFPRRSFRLRSSNQAHRYGTMS
jgi:hypothetical protein